MSTRWTIYLYAVTHGVGAYLRIVAHDVVEAGEKTIASGNLRMHGAVDIVEEIECLTDQLVALSQQTLLNLCLAAREHVVGIRCLNNTHSIITKMFSSFLAILVGTI